MERLRLLQAAHVSIWIEDPDPSAPALDPHAIGGARVAPPTVASHRSRIEQLATAEQADATGAYLDLVVADVRAAARALHARYEVTAGLDGFVEVPCPPDTAGSASAIVRAAQALVRRARVPNVVVCVPGTDAGVAAVQELTYRGVGTAIDGVYCADRHAQAAEAFIRGLERRLIAGLALGGVGSVTWTRIQPLHERLDRVLPASSPLRGAVAPAVAQSIYLDAVRRFSGPRWRRLARHGARPQRPAFSAIDSVDVVEQLALPGAVVAVPSPLLAEMCDRGPDSAAEVDETAVAWLLREASAAGARLGRVAVELRCTTDEQRAFAHRAVLAVLGDQLRRRRAPRGARTEARR